MRSKKEQENNNNSINSSEESVQNIVRLIKKQFNDMRMSDSLNKLEPQWKLAIRKGKKNPNKTKRNIQDKKQAQLHKEHIREQRFEIIHQGLQELKEITCDNISLELFKTIEEIQEFAVKYESEPSSVSNQDWNRFERIVLSNLEFQLKTELVEKEKQDDLPTLTEDEANVLDYLKNEYPQIRFQQDIVSSCDRDRKTIRTILDRLMVYRLVSRPEGKLRGYVITTQGQKYIEDYF